MATTTYPLAAQPAADNKWMVAASISFGALMATIDLSIVNVALPQIRGSIGASIDEMASVATSFAIAQVIVMPLTAFLARFFGQKRVYLFCLGLFVAASVLCGMSRSLVQLVIARAIQGVGAGVLMPTQMAILRQTFPPREQGMAMAMFAMVAVVGPAIGPTLGGWLVDNWSWPWIFFINIPVGFLGIVMVARFVHEAPEFRHISAETRAQMRRTIDWLGIGLMSLGFACMQYVLEQGPREDWFSNPFIAVLTAVAGFSLVGFVVRELRVRAPAVNLSLFRDSVFTSGTAIAGVMFAILMANMFLLPVFMQELLGFTALQSGLALMPRSLVMLVATPIVGRLYNVTSPRLLVALGLIGVAAGSWQMGGYTLQTGTHDIVLGMVIQGVGFSLLFVPLTTVALSHVERRFIADASGLNSLVRQLGGSVGLAIFTTLLARFVVRAHDSLIADIDPSRLVVSTRMMGMERAFMARGMDAASAHGAALAAMAAMVGRQAQLIAFDKSFQLSALCMAALLPLTLLLRQPRHHAGERPHVEVEPG
jgi:DHA2 family multidrug resistance protein